MISPSAILACVLFGCLFGIAIGVFVGVIWVSKNTKGAIDAWQGAAAEWKKNYEMAVRHRDDEQPESK